MLPEEGIGHLYRSQVIHDEGLAVRRDAPGDPLAHRNLDLPGQPLLGPVRLVKSQLLAAPIQQQDGRVIDGENLGDALQEPAQQIVEVLIGQRNIGHGLNRSQTLHGHLGGCACPVRVTPVALGQTAHHRDSQADHQKDGQADEVGWVSERPVDMRLECHHIDQHDSDQRGHQARPYAPIQGDDHDRQQGQGVGKGEAGKCICQPGRYRGGQHLERHGDQIADKRMVPGLLQPGGGKGAGDDPVAHRAPDRVAVISRRLTFQVGLHRTLRQANSSLHHLYYAICGRPNVARPARRYRRSAPVPYWPGAQRQNGWAAGSA